MKKTLKNEKGFVLIVSLMMLVVLMIIGIAATSTTNIELQISGNDKSAQMAFYGADAGNELAKELIEQAIETRGWSDETEETEKVIGNATITNKDFWLNDELDDDPAVDSPTTSDNSDVELSFDRGITRLRIGGDGGLASGGAIQMAAGYEGIGKSASGGGSWFFYDVRSRHEGVNNSQKQIRGRYRHVN